MGAALIFGTAAGLATWWEASHLLADLSFRTPSTGRNFVDKFAILAGPLVGILVWFPLAWIAERIAPTPKSDKPNAE
jgi:hypothetical protein